MVDEQDNPKGTMEKMEAHHKGVLHRAFSIFIFNKAGEVLLQQRADSKYHNGGLWTNTCCSHPAPGEDLSNSAVARLQDEMGFTTGIVPAFNFTYKATFQNGLTEHEFDHVFIGYYDGPVNPNPEEVKQAEFCNVNDISKEILENPSKFTVWFRIAFPRVIIFLQQ